VATELLVSRVRIQLSTWVSISCVCCVGNGLCNKATTHTEESYWVCVFLSVYNLETSKEGRLGPNWAAVSQKYKYERCRFRSL